MSDFVRTMMAARRRKLERVLCAGAIVGTTVITATWWARVLARRPPAGAAQSVHALFEGRVPIVDGIVAVTVALLVGLALFRRRSLIAPRVASLALIVSALSIAASAALPHGHHAAIVGFAALVALVATSLWPERWRSRSRPEEARSARWVALAIFVLVTGVHAFFSMHRHAWFGSGSWDAGCMVHNFYRTSRFLDTTSTVLGDVDFLGDHFMVGLYLFAPLAWVDASAYTLLGIQAASLAMVAPVIFLILEDRGAPRGASVIVAIAASLAFGFQSAAYFDIHEISIAIGFLALAVLSLERDRLGWTTLFLVLFSSFKESLGAYVLAIGLLVVWRGLRTNDRRKLIFGTGWIAYGALGFVLVNRFFMPALIARANRPEPHETFADFGPTVFAAVVGIIGHPVEAVSALFVPSEKVASLLVTFGGLGFLAFSRPEITIAALPLLAERFLSSKTTMWEMGYHYAAPLTFYVAWAVALGWPAMRVWVDRCLAELDPELGRRASIFIPVYVLASTVLINALSYKHPSNFHRLEEDYFSTPPRRVANQRAVDLLESQGTEAKLAVQNRILPHLAHRPFVWRLGEHDKADFVLLNVAESAWPYDDGLPRRLAIQLGGDPGWRLIFSEGETAVFARVDKTGLPAVLPAPALGLRPQGAAPTD